MTEDPDEAACRRVDLPGHRTLSIRPIRDSDEADLIRLYESLSEEDHYCRFFTATGPPRHVVDKLVRIDDRGGIGLVAVIEEPDGSRRLVGEASCGRLQNGNGELGITVAQDERGWLGPYLLDALVEQAARRGIPNIEAQVLFVNRRMLAVLARRGLVYLDHDDPAIFHVAIGTGARVPSWPPRHDRRRLLVEIPGGHWPMEKAARAAGFEVLACAGPLRDRTLCPALLGEPCPLVAGADLVVDAFPGEAGSSLSEAHRRMFPAIPLCVGAPDESEVDGGSAERIPPGDDEASVVAALRRLSKPAPGDCRPGER